MVSRGRASDTKARIQAVARELFAQQGVEKTSLREIAERLGITKPALYYHFESREALVASIIQPLLEEMEGFVAAREAGPRPGARALLADYFDLLREHRAVITMVVHDLSTLAYLDLGARMFEWRRRLITLLLGPNPSRAALARAVVAIGGMSDCAVEFGDAEMVEIRAVAIDAACAALGLD